MGSEDTGPVRGERWPGGGGGRLGGQNRRSKTKNVQSVVSGRDGDTFVTPQGPHTWGSFLRSLLGTVPTPQRPAHPGAGRGSRPAW